MSNNYSQDIPYTKQSDMQEYIDAFNVENESIDFATLENYSNSDYVFNTSALQKVKNNIDVMQSNFNNDISGLDDKHELFQSWVNNLSANIKPWQSGAENKYYKGDIVTYNSRDEGAIFLCTEDCDGSLAYELPSFRKITDNDGDGNTFMFGVRYVPTSTLYYFTGTYGTSKTETFGNVATVIYDGKYNINLIVNNLIHFSNFNFWGSKELYNQIYFAIEDSPWLRIYPRGNAGLDAFEFGWRGEWQSGESYTVGAAIPTEFLPPSLVWYQVGRDINFYACIQDVTSDIPPDQDTTHWIKLFSKQLDAFVILDEMPSQAYFDNEMNPSVFGVVDETQSVNAIKIIDRIHTTDVSDPFYLLLRGSGSSLRDDNGVSFNTILRNLILEINI